VETLDDAALIRNVARRRDRDSFSLLYDRHAPMVFALARRMLPQKEDAEEILADVFLNAWNKAAAFDPARGPVGAWLLVMARSRCLDRLRRRSLRQDREVTIYTEEAEGVLPISEPGAPVLETLVTDERRAQIAGALRDLPAPQRMALEAAYFDGLTQAEIAEKSGEPLGTVKTRMRLGLQKLAEALAGFKKS